MDTATTTSASVQPSFAQRLRRSLAREFQRLLDLSAPQIAARYVALGVALGIYALRVYLISGFYIISYALGIFLLNLFIGFLSPQEDPDAAEGFALPNAAGDEFKPFVRRLPEFKFWYSSLKAVCISFLCTFLPFLDVPVFWPILLFYFLMLFGLTMRRQITHMIQHKYIPFSRGKPAYTSGKKGDPTASTVKPSASAAAASATSAAVAASNSAAAAAAAAAAVATANARRLPPPTLAGSLSSTGESTSATMVSRSHIAANAAAAAAGIAPASAPITAAVPLHRAELNQTTHGLGSNQSFSSYPTLPSAATSTAASTEGGAASAASLPPPAPLARPVLRANPLAENK
jgi:hypothetical protein